MFGWLRAGSTFWPFSRHRLLIMDLCQSILYIHPSVLLHVYKQNLWFLMYSLPMIWQTSSLKSKKLHRWGTCATGLSSVLSMLKIFKICTLKMSLYNKRYAMGALRLDFCNVHWLVRHDGQRWENGLMLENNVNYLQLLQSHPSAVLSFSMLNSVIEYITFLTEYSSLFSLVFSVTPGLWATSTLQWLYNFPQKET